MWKASAIWSCIRCPWKLLRIFSSSLKCAIPFCKLLPTKNRCRLAPLAIVATDGIPMNAFRMHFQSICWLAEELSPVATGTWSKSLGKQGSRLSLLALHSNVAKAILIKRSATTGLLYMSCKPAPIQRWLNITLQDFNLQGTGFSPECSCLCPQTTQ